MDNKNKILILSSLTLGVVAVAGTLIASNSIRIKADTENYVIECDSSKNLLTNSATSTSGTNTVKTKIGNDKTFEYSLLSHSDGSWQTIEENGYILNTSKIEGISSLDITFVNDNATISLQYGWNVLEPESKVDLSAENKHITYSFDKVEGKYPSLMKITATNSVQTISTMKIVFQCSESDVMTKTEFSKLFDYSIYQGNISITKYKGTASTLSIPAKVFGDQMYSVTSIGMLAFSDCTTLTSVIIPNSFTKINDYAFARCKSLTSISLPDTVTEIGASAFEDTSLKSISLSKYITKVGLGAFGTPTLTTIVVDPENTVYDSRDNCNAIIDSSTDKLVVGCTGTVIPDTVTSIAGAAFYKSGIKNISISKSITNIETAAFWKCSLIESISVDSENTVYDSRDNCNAIIDSSSNSLIFGCKNSSIPSSVTTISNGSFTDCTSLESISIPSSVTSIDEQAFRGCSSLASIEVDSENTVYDSRDNCNAIIKTSTNTIITGCKTTVIPETVTELGNYAFYGNTSLTSITIPNNIVSIKSGAFYGSSLASITIKCKASAFADAVFSSCKSLETVNISSDIVTNFSTVFKNCSTIKNVSFLDDCVSIPAEAFMNNTSIVSVSIPESVSLIGNYSFYGCTSLSSVSIATGVITIGEGAFAVTALESIIIPSSVSEIAMGAFYGCESLTSINFSGTKAEWNLITKGEMWHEECPATVVHCSDGDAALD